MKNDFNEGIKFIKKRKDIVVMILILLALNFFLGFSATVPIPYIINTYLKLSPTAFGIIESAFPFGIILGALLIKKVIEKVSRMKLLILMSITLSISIIIGGIPLMFATRFQDLFYIVYYTILMCIFGIIIASIDIPVMYMLQNTVTDEFRGRVLGLGMGIVKVVQPIAFIFSGILLNKVNPLYIVVIGGSLFFLSSLIISKYTKNNVV